MPVVLCGVARYRAQLELYVSLEGYIRLVERSLDPSLQCPVKSLHRGVATRPVERRAAVLNAAALQILLELSAGQLGAVVRNDLVGIALP